MAWPKMIPAATPLLSDIFFDLSQSTTAWLRRANGNANPKLLREAARAALSRLPRSKLTLSRKRASALRYLWADWHRTANLTGYAMRVGSLRSMTLRRRQY